MTWIVAESWAIIASIVNTAWFKVLAPQVHLIDILERIVSGRTMGHPFPELLAWNWKAARVLRQHRMSIRVSGAR